MQKNTQEDQQAKKVRRLLLQKDRGSDSTFRETTPRASRSRRGMIFKIRPEDIANPFEASEMWLTQMPAGTPPTRCLNPDGRPRERMKEGMLSGPQSDTAAHVSA